MTVSREALHRQLCEQLSVEIGAMKSCSSRATAGRACPRVPLWLLSATLGSHQRHHGYVTTSRRLSRYRFASAKAVNSRAVFLASPR